MYCKNKDSQEIIDCTRNESQQNETAQRAQYVFPMHVTVHAKTNNVLQHM